MPRRIGVVGHPQYDTLPAALALLVELAERRGLQLRFEEALQPLVASGETMRADRLDELDLLLTFGGDGTLLRGARAVAPFGTPVLGINFGHLGFLTAVAPEALERALEAVLTGDVVLDERMVLEVTAEAADGSVHGRFLALNDAVLHRGGVARMIRMTLSVHGEEIGTYSADGIILSTPTGSTAYSLSAGGPVVSPSVNCIVATAICPHTLAVRPLVLPATETVTVEVLYPDEEIILTIDGQVGASLAPGDRIVVRRAPVPLRLVRLPGQTFFSTLRRKLQWGGLEEREETARSR
jgi:NAD+ kinase